jgi:hypothetical protein
MVEPLRHRQTKGAETDMPSLPPPRHIPTLPHRKTRLALGSDRNGASLCENVRKPRMRRMVFLYCLLLIAPPELLVFRLTKSRRTFYAHDERLSFRTASGMKTRSRDQDRMAGVGSVKRPSPEFGAMGETRRFPTFASSRPGPHGFRPESRRSRMRAR